MQINQSDEYILLKHVYEFQEKAAVWGAMYAGEGTAKAHHEAMTDAKQKLLDFIKEL